MTVELISVGTEILLGNIVNSNAAYLSEWMGNRKIELPFDSDRFDRLLAERSVASVRKKEEEASRDDSKQARWQVRW